MIVRTTNRIGVAASLVLLGVTLANHARAVDLRDWGRKYDASERFVVLPEFNNEAVLDKETQLLWARTARSATKWIFAVHNCYASGVGGRYGWRLPSFTELLSLVGTGGVLPVGHPFVVEVPTQTYFWSTTEHALDPDYAWSKPLLSNVISARSKDLSQPYLCVRGLGSDQR
jgi:hypothetical protein